MTAFYSGNTSASRPFTANSVTSFLGYQAQAHAPASGLVSLSTSDTPSDPIPLESPLLLRYRRLRRTVATVATMIQDGLQAAKIRYRAAMITLTYRDGTDWHPRHITETLKRARAWANRKGIRLRYVWVLELTKRGRPHYHLILWLPRGITPPMFDKQGWWQHGMTNAVWAKKPVGYLVKYASKGLDDDQRGQIPKGARIHGSGGLNAPQRADKCWLLAPQWVKQIFPRQDGVRRASLTVPGWYLARDNTLKRKRAGYWLSRRSGLAFRTPWTFDWQSRLLSWQGIGWQSVNPIRLAGACIPICRFPYLR